MAKRGGGGGGSNSSAAEFNSLATDIANPVTHSALDFFEKPSVLVNYESGFDQEIFPQVGCNGPTLEFVVSGDTRNCIDLNLIQISVHASIYNSDGSEKLKSDDGKTVIFANNSLHSLFSQCEIYLNGVLVSDSNNSYHHRSFIETELTTTIESKNTWTQCQGYQYNENPADEKSSYYVDQFKNTIEADYRLNFYGSLYVDFFTCEKLLLPEVSMRIKLYRSSNEFALISLGDEKGNVFQAVIDKASLFVRKVTVTESVRLSIERALLKSPARYPYIESLCKSFIIQSGQNTFIKESIFGTEPIRRLTVCMISNEDFRGRASTSPFHYKKFGLRKLEIVRGNGLPIAGTPVDTTSIVRLYHNSLNALGFKNGGNGIKLGNFEDHFMLTFDLTSSQEASKNFTLFPELTGAPLTLKLSFDDGLKKAVELYLIGERYSQVFIDSQRNILKNRTTIASHG